MFNLITFSGTRTYYFPSPCLLPPTIFGSPKSLLRAIGMGRQGDDESDPGLAGGPIHQTMCAIVCFVTDGDVGNEWR